MDTDLANEALKNAEEMLAREGLTWIAESSLHPSRFLLGYLLRSREGGDGSRPEPDSPRGDSRDHARKNG